MDYQFRTMLQQTCSWEQSAGINHQGERLFKPPQEIQCFRQEKQTRVLNDQGAEVISRAKLFFDSRFSLTVHDRFDGFLAIACEKRYDCLGNLEYVAIYL